MLRNGTQASGAPTTRLAVHSFHRTTHSATPRSEKRAALSAMPLTRGADPRRPVGRLDTAHGSDVLVHGTESRRPRRCAALLLQAVRLCMEGRDGDGVWDAHDGLMWWSTRSLWIMGGMARHGGNRGGNSLGVMLWCVSLSLSLSCGGLVCCGVLHASVRAGLCLAQQRRGSEYAYCTEEPPVPHSSAPPYGTILTPTLLACPTTLFTIASIPNPLSLSSPHLIFAISHTAFSPTGLPTSRRPAFPTTAAAIAAPVALSAAACPAAPARPAPLRRPPVFSGATPAALRSSADVGGVRSSKLKLRSARMCTRAGIGVPGTKALVRALNSWRGC